VVFFLTSMKGDLNHLLLPSPPHLLEMSLQDKIVITRQDKAMKRNDSIFF